MEKGVIRNPIVKLLLEPHIKSEMADEVFHGTMVTVLGELSGGWLKVRTEYGYWGYLQRDEVNFEHAYTHRMMVNSLFADVLIQPKVQSYVKDTFPLGSFLKVVEHNAAETFSQVQLIDDRIGWVRSAFLSKHEATRDFTQEEYLRERIAAAALRYLDVQYRWGGRSPLGIDCSGLCFMAYFLNGITIYRDSAISRDFPLKEITLHKTKKGDVLYFPGHMALCLGDGKFVHASSQESKVVISSLNPDDSCYRGDLKESLLYAGSIFPQ